MKDLKLYLVTDWSGQVIDDVLLAEEIPYNNQPYSVKIKVPPMAAIVLKVMNNKSK